MGGTHLWTLTLVGWCQAYSLPAIPRVGTADPRRSSDVCMNTLSSTQDAFCETSSFRNGVGREYWSSERRLGSTGSQSAAERAMRRAQSTAASVSARALEPVPATTQMPAPTPASAPVALEAPARNTAGKFRADAEVPHYLRSSEDNEMMLAKQERRRELLVTSDTAIAQARAFLRNQPHM